METCDVLVVGAGPTGLVAAAVLAQHGVDVRVVERAPERLDQSRALVVHARTLELMDKLGLADAMVEAGHPAVQTNFYAEGTRILQVPFGEVAVGETPFPFVLFLSQVETERVLDRHLEAVGVPVDRPVELVRLEQSADGVVARLVKEGVESGLRCRYLIGADGAHSRVRHELGLPFEGAAYQSDFVLGDVVISGLDKPLDELHVFLGRVGFCALFPLKGGTTRIIASRIDTSAGDSELTLQELEQTAALILGEPLTLSDPDWLSRFHLHHRGVPRYREGRCFVAGDAAHIHSPAGGQGMNTGMQDAYNLAWKLGMVVNGQASERLLDSYQAERHPVGKRLLQFTDRAFTLGAEQPPWVNAIRNFLAPHVVPRVAGLGGPARIFRFLSQIGIRYRRSPAVDEDLTGATADFKRGPRAGDRAPGEALLRELVGPEWWLLAFTGGGAPSDRWRALVEAVALDRPRVRIRWVDDAESHARYSLKGPGLYLVRPDGHIAFRSAGQRLDRLHAWWSRQTVDTPDT